MACWEGRILPIATKIVKCCIGGREAGKVSRKQRGRVWGQEESGQEVFQAQEGVRDRGRDLCCIRSSVSDLNALNSWGRSE